MKKLLLANEAIARGAIEADVRFVTSYPGTPSTEIATAMCKAHVKHGVYFEFSTNEKVAVEAAAGASLSGLRSMAVMKHVGINVASDPLMTLAYVGAKGGMVIISADDPGCHSSQNEQDNRIYGRFFNLPVLEPSLAQEAKDMTAHAFDLSEQVELPVLLRTTTAISHQRGVVELGDRVDTKQEGEFIKDPRFIERQNAHRRLLDKMKKAAQISENSLWNKIYDFGDISQSEIGFIANGISFSYLADTVRKYNLDASIFKIGFSNPLPDQKIKNFVSKFKKIIVIEELEPFIEDQVFRIAQQAGIDVEIIGKRSETFQFEGEYNSDIVRQAIAPYFESIKLQKPVSAMKAHTRYATMCPGCGHRNTFYAVKKVFKHEAIYANDIGCYALGITPPMHMGDIWLCMGGGIGFAAGTSYAVPQPTVAFIGDGTLLHSGLHAVLNAVHNRHNFLLVVMDNSITAMTGHQPNPSCRSKDDFKESDYIDTEMVLCGMGVRHIEVIDPREIRNAIAIFKQMKEISGFRVVIARQPCIVNELKKSEEIPKTNKYWVDATKCDHCARCISDYNCPAFGIDQDKNIYIVDSLCIGCGDCLQICPCNAIEREIAT